MFSRWLALQEKQLYDRVKTSVEKVGNKSRLNPDFLIFLAGRLNPDFFIFLAGHLILPTFCRLFRKTPDFNDFFNFWTLADLIPTSTLSTLVLMKEWIRRNAFSVSVQAQLQFA